VVFITNQASGLNIGKKWQQLLQQASPSPVRKKGSNTFLLSTLQKQ